MPEMRIISCKEIWQAKRFAKIPMHILPKIFSITKKESKAKQEALGGICLGQAKLKATS